MRMVGFIDGQKKFVRDDVTPQDAQCIAAHIKELADFQKKRLVLLLEHENVTYMIKAQVKRIQTDGE
jgi:hypothetical protein